MIVMRVLLFVLHVSMVRECEGARMTENTGVVDREGVVVVRAQNECVAGTRGSCILSSAADVLGMSAVRGMGQFYRQACKSE